MPFIKKHWEKILLSIVLLGLAVAAAALPLEVSRVREYLSMQRDRIVVRTDPKPFQGVDLSTNRATLKRLAGPIDLEFAHGHNIFNPVQWQKRQPDGTYYKIPTSEHIGPAALVVTQIEELDLTVSFEGVEGTPENPRYRFTINREGESKQTITATTRIPRNKHFTLQEILGPKESPSGFKLQLQDDKEPIIVMKDKPYTRVIGYSAGLKYPPHNQNFAKAFRVKDPLRLMYDNETYKIVAINRNEVTVAADSTKKRTTVRLNATPQVK